MKFKIQISDFMIKARAHKRKETKSDIRTYLNLASLFIGHKTL